MMLLQVVGTLVVLTAYYLVASGKADGQGFIGDRVRVHWHFRKRCFSVAQNGKVVAYLDHLSLTDATFRVQPAGQAKCRREGRKNVHAFIYGTLDSFFPTLYGDIDNYEKVRYNPYETDTFVDERGTPVHEAQNVMLDNTKGVFAHL